MFLLALIVGIIGAEPTASGAEILLRPSAWLFSSCQFTLSRVRRYSGRTSHRSWVSSSTVSSPLLEGSPPHLTGCWGLSLVPGGLLVCLFGARLQKSVPQKFIKLMPGTMIVVLAFKYVVQFFRWANGSPCFPVSSFRKRQFTSSSASGNIIIRLQLLQPPASWFNRHTSRFAHRTHFRSVDRYRQRNQGLIGNPDISLAT